MRILTASAAVDGAVLGLGGLFWVAARVMATTTASERIHPLMKNAALMTPPLRRQNQGEGGEREWARR